MDNKKVGFIDGVQLLERARTVFAAGRLTFELYADSTPKTAENFRVLATGENGHSNSGVKLHLKVFNVLVLLSSALHRLLDLCRGAHFIA